MATLIWTSTDKDTTPGPFKRRTLKTDPTSTLGVQYTMNRTLAAIVVEMGLNIPLGDDASSRSDEIQLSSLMDVFSQRRRMAILIFITTIVPSFYIHQDYVGRIFIIHLFRPTCSCYPHHQTLDFHTHRQKAIIASGSHRRSRTS